jgi:dsDNA-specific endonuclease/ATPase MutS2
MGSNKTSEGKGVRIVDLHLKPGYNQGDAVERQLARFRGELDSAIKAGTREIIFIHGVGSGVLKNELRSIVSSEYPSCSYADASFSRFGSGGATLVTIGK